MLTRPTLIFRANPHGRVQVTRYEKALRRILAGTADANVPFEDLCEVLRRLGFEERVRASHHIFARTDIAEIVNLQPRGGKAKPYQVRQVRELIIRYELGGRPESE